MAITTTSTSTEHATNKNPFSPVGRKSRPPMLEIPGSLPPPPSPLRPARAPVPQTHLQGESPARQPRRRRRVWDDLPTPLADKEDVVRFTRAHAKKQVGTIDFASSWSSLFSWRGLSISSCEDNGNGVSQRDRRMPLYFPAHENIDGHLRHISREALECFQKECRTVTATNRSVGSVRNSAVRFSSSEKGVTWTRGAGEGVIERKETNASKGHMYQQHQQQHVHCGAGNATSISVESRVERPASRTVAAGIGAVASNEGLFLWQARGPGIRAVASDAGGTGTGFGIGIGSRRGVSTAVSGITTQASTQPNGRRVFTLQGTIASSVPAGDPKQLPVPAMPPKCPAKNLRANAATAASRDEKSGGSSRRGGNSSSRGGSSCEIEPLALSERARLQEFLSPPRHPPLPPAPSHSHSHRYSSCLSAADSTAFLAAMASALPAALQLLPALPTCHATLPRYLAAPPPKQHPAVACQSCDNIPTVGPLEPLTSSSTLAVPEAAAMVAHVCSEGEGVGTAGAVDSGASQAGRKVSPAVRLCTVAARKPMGESPSSVLHSPLASPSSESPDGTPSTCALL